MRIKNLYNEYKKAQEEASRFENMMLEDFENEELETAFDEAYTKEFNLFNQLAEEVMNLIHCERAIANAMIIKEQARFESLINKLA